MTSKIDSLPQKAPDFSLVGHDDKRYKLASFAGKWLIVYFYPKDDTPGCTAQACSIRDIHQELVDSNVTVVGISMDTPEDHRNFIAKYQIPFLLLSDPDGKTIRDYSAWGKKMFGVEGILRKTFIIDPDGVIQKIYHRVTPHTQGSRLQKDLPTLMGSSSARE